MNNRKRKRLKVARKGCVDKRKRICQIFDLCLKINSLESRTQKETGKLPTVFFDFHGHVSKIEICINLDGWEAYKDCDVYYEIYLGKRPYEQSKVEECYNKLKEIYESMETADDTRQ